MRTLVRVALVVGVLSLFGASALAQVDVQNNELGFSGNLSKSLQEGSKAQITGMIHYGRMMNQWLEGLQIGGDAIISGPLDMSSGSFMYIMPTVRYFFSPKDPRMTPYVGLALGFFFFNGELQSSVTIDPHGGVKYFLNENTALFAQLDYLAQSDYFDKGTLQFSVGLSVFF
jgi:hypothetical protein